MTVLQESATMPLNRQIAAWHRVRNKRERDKETEVGVRICGKSTSLIGGGRRVQGLFKRNKETQCNRVNAGSAKSMNCRVQVVAGSSKTAGETQVSAWH